MKIGSTIIRGQLVSAEIHTPKPNSKTGELKPPSLTVSVMSIFNDFGKSVPKVINISLSDVSRREEFSSNIGKMVSVPVAIDEPKFINLVGEIEILSK